MGGPGRIGRRPGRTVKFDVMAGTAGWPCRLVTHGFAFPSAFRRRHIHMASIAG